MTNKLKKWPQNWVEHVDKTCSFYFEDKDISFIESKTLRSDKTENAQIYSMTLTFKKYDKIYDIFIHHCYNTFVINYYYKKYYKKRKALEQDFIFMMDTILNGADKTGCFNYTELGGQALRDYLASAYEISQSIENIINNHIDRDDDDNEGENDPVEPPSPSNEIKPELLCY